MSGLGQRGQQRGQLLSGSSELTRRVITGLVGGGGLVAAIIFGGSIGVSLFAFGLALAMVHEFSEMTFQLGDRQEKRYLLLLLTLVAMLLAVFSPMVEFEVLIFAFLILFGFFLATSVRHDGDEFREHFRELQFALFGLVYLGFVPTYFPRLQAQAHGTKWVVLFLFINWASDSVAYFVGKKYGRRKLFPTISPKKTVEGAYGALGGAFALTLVLKLVWFKELSWLAVVFIPLIVSAASQVGDLCESYLKRAYALKDSGSLLPGHGGFLDRFDGVVFSLPIMYALSRIFS